MSKRILIISDAPGLRSGLGRTCRELATRFTKDKFDVAIAGWGFGNLPHKFPFHIYPINKGSKTEAREVLISIKNWQADIVLAIGDIFNFLYLPKVAEKLAHKPKFFGYITVDGEPLSYKWLDTFQLFSKTLVWSEYGKKQIKVLDSQIEPEVVYPGVDHQVFRPLKKVGDNIFKILNVSQNTDRKNIPATLKAFAEFSRNKDNTLLALVCDSKDPNGYDLREIIFNLKIENKVRIIESNARNSIGDDDLNRVYNQADVSILSSAGEGFGLSLAESFATNTVPIATDFTSMTELLADGRGILVKPGSYVYGARNLVRAIISHKGLVDSLETAYQRIMGNIGLNSYIRKGREFVKNLTWDNCYKKIKSTILSAEGKGTVKPFPIYGQNNEIRQRAGISIAKLKRPRIGLLKLGGIGDCLQCFPLISGIKKKYPESSLTVFCEGSPEIYTKNKNIDKVSRVGRRLQQEMVNSLQPLFDIFYDVRYVSRVFGEKPSDYFLKYKWFYDNWALSNNQLDRIGDNVIDMIIKSCGLQDYCSLEDMSLETEEFPLPKKPYVVMHNSGGNIGQLKLLPIQTCKAIVDYLNRKGISVVQPGVREDIYINGCLDYRGKTNLFQTANLIKNSEFYIGIEGLLAHLAKAVGKKSIICFGNTPVSCFGYKENINLSQQKCQPCLWASGQAHNECMLKHDYCRNLPTVEMIIEMIGGIK